MVTSTHSQMRRRRAWYAVRNWIGFDGYRTGSWRHVMHRVMRPRLHMGRWLGIGLIASVWMISWVGSVLGGLGLIRGAGVATVATSAGWLAAALGSLAVDVARSGSQPPPLWPPPDSGVREPRRLPPSPGAGAVRLDVPGLPDS